MSDLLKLNQENRAPVEQTKKSKKIINDMVINAEASLSAMIQKNLQFEQKRNEIVVNTRKTFSKDYEDLKTQVADEMEQVNEQWEDVLKIDLPLNLHQEIELQKKRMDSILKEKLDFIAGLEKDVIMRDHEYVNRINEQKNMVDEFVRKMRLQEEELKKSMADEYSKIEASYKQEVASRTYQLDREIKDLSTKRQEKETSLMNDIINTTINQRMELEALRRENNEMFNRTRAALEAKLQIAQKEQEDRKAQYIYSLSQLDYDYKILQETREEHENKLKLQNDKKSRQRDVLMRLKEKYHKGNEEFIEINESITKEYKRIASSYRELQSRFRNVAYTDFSNFREVWNMNEKRLHELVLKVISADNVVMSQQLGREINTPDPEYLRRWIIGTDEYEALTKTPQLPDQSEELEEKVPDNILTTPGLSENLEHLRRMLVDEVGFLVDYRVKDILGIDPYADIDEDLQTIKLESLLKELGIVSSEDVETLLVYFVKDPEFNALEAPKFVSPHEVLDALRRFVDEYHPHKQKAQMNLFTNITKDATQNTSSEVARAIMQLQSTMKKQLIGQRHFWEKKSQIITERMWRIWNSTFKGMQRYNEILEKRAKLIKETDALKLQNEELSGILQNYIDAQDDTALIYPPGDTVGFYN